MLAILQDIEVGFLLDGRVLESLLGTQVLLKQSTPPEPIQGRRKPVFILSSISHNCEHLIQEEDRRQLPVYYVSQAFQGAKAKYPRIEKFAFALIVTSRKLHPYFQANPILVMTDQPIKKSMNKLEAAGRMI